MQIHHVWIVRLIRNQYVMIENIDSHANWGQRIGIMWLYMLVVPTQLILL